MSSLLDNVPEPPEHGQMEPHACPHTDKLNELAQSVKVIESNYATREALTNLSGKVDHMQLQMQLAFAQQELAIRKTLDEAFKANTAEMHKMFATKAELTNAINQQTWRLAAFFTVLFSAGFAFARFL